MRLACGTDGVCVVQELVKSHQNLIQSTARPSRRGGPRHGQSQRL